MIYAYIFVMAGVTYLIRMLPLTLIQKNDIQCIHTFLFILRALCMPYCYDLSRYFIRNGIACIRFAGLAAAIIFSMKAKKPCNGGVVFPV